MPWPSPASNLRQKRSFDASLNDASLHMTSHVFTRELLAVTGTETSAEEPGMKDRLRSAQRLSQSDLKLIDQV